MPLVTSRTLVHRVGSDARDGGPAACPTTTPPSVDRMDGPPAAARRIMAMASGSAVDTAAPDHPLGGPHPTD
jgi:hypothetical protein